MSLIGAYWVALAPVPWALMTYTTLGLIGARCPRPVVVVIVVVIVNAVILTGILINSIIIMSRSGVGVGGVAAVVAVAVAVGVAPAWRSRG